MRQASAASSDSRMAIAVEFMMRVIGLALLFPSVSILITARTTPLVVDAATIGGARNQRFA